MLPSPPYITFYIAVGEERRGNYSVTFSDISESAGVTDIISTIWPSSSWRAFRSLHQGSFYRWITCTIYITCTYHLIERFLLKWPGDRFLLKELLCYCLRKQLHSTALSSHLDSNFYSPNVTLQCRYESSWFLLFIGHNYPLWLVYTAYVELLTSIHKPAYNKPPYEITIWQLVIYFYGNTGKDVICWKYYL